jgi:CRISPR-associated endonuclease Csn1
MKRILGLDLGTTSIGWALINEAEKSGELSSIIKAGVRVIPLSSDEQQDFQKGKAATTNASRTQKRGARRNLQRYKLRRQNLNDLLFQSGIVNSDFNIHILGEKDPRKIWELRANAAKQKIELQDFARVLFAINKKRGYKSNRKAKDKDDGMAVDGMKVATQMYEERITPGQYVLARLTEGKLFIPDFYPSDLNAEFLKIWDKQATYYTKELSQELLANLQGKNKTSTGIEFRKTLGLAGKKLAGSTAEKRLALYSMRSQALTEKLELEDIELVLSEINGQIAGTSGLLGQISDRSKKLYIGKITVGQYLYEQIQQSPHNLLKKQVFYRQDYLDEFERIWETQAAFHGQLTVHLKEEIRDIVIFYQRKLKSKKGELSICQFEEVELIIDGKNKIVGPKVIAKSNPLFQEFRMWQILNNLELTHKKDGHEFVIELEQKQMIAAELYKNEELKDSAIIKILGENSRNWFSNFKEIKGHSTQIRLINALNKILSFESLDVDLEIMEFQQGIEKIKENLSKLGISKDIIGFDFGSISLEKATFENQVAYQFYHLIYSAEDDVALKNTLINKYNIPSDYTGPLLNIGFEDDYGSLSARAIKKILPHLHDGLEFSDACTYAGYNHSDSETTAEKDKRVLKEKLELLPRNSLRNPIVEKILNQMVHVVNGVVTTYGKIDEVRIEMARELNQTAKMREEATKAIASATVQHAQYKKTLKTEYNLPRVTRNDIIKYKLYLELETNGFKTLYSGQTINKGELFTNKYDIEHIIPKSRIFDDSFSNKTLELADVNKEKSNDTALDYIQIKQGEEGVFAYKERCLNLYSNGKLSKTKYQKLIMSGEDIKDDFLARDLVNTAYIAKKALSMLKQMVYDVHTTNGRVTDKLRQDWEIIEVLKELNWDKYETAGLTEYIEGKHGEKLARIKDWTKRNDHRHHAMDAITVAFTKKQFVQFFSNLNARSNKSGEIYGIEQKYFYRTDKGKLRAKSPLSNMRQACKDSLEEIIVSYKAKNKVVTPGKNNVRVKGKRLKNPQITLTPRGQLHKETVYGKSIIQGSKEIKVSPKFDLELINKVTSPKYREALLRRLIENNNDPKKAFGGANALVKNPLFLNGMEGQTIPESVKITENTEVLTIRKDIGPDLKIEKVVDPAIRCILQQRLNDFNNNPKAAFVNLEKDPIWQNEKQGIALKKVTITGVSNAEPLHYKKDQLGNELKDDNGKKIPSDWVSTGNNHHVAIYKDEKGNLHEEVVSLFEAVSRAKDKQPIIDKEKQGMEFLFTMKQNEIFVFPNEKTGFNPNEIDLLDPKNIQSIIPNMFRVQKISNKNYLFTHIYETEATNGEHLKNLKGLIGLKYYIIRTPEYLKEVVKVRINHLGVITSVGEY